jgi:hypothetical protein
MRSTHSAALLLLALLLVGNFGAWAVQKTVPAPKKRSSHLDKLHMFEKAWKHVDKDGDGQINLLQFATAYRSIAKKLQRKAPTTNVIASAFAQLDREGASRINKNSFMNFFRKTEARPPFDETSFTKWSALSQKRSKV